MRGTCYLLASKKGGTLYCGVTSDLPRRWWEHQQGLGSFTSRHGVMRLVWYEEFL
jgi:putative endonuclease